jgi:hypothetical protein
VMHWHGCQGAPSCEAHECDPLSSTHWRPQFYTTGSGTLSAATTCHHAARTAWQHVFATPCDQLVVVTVPLFS